MPASSRPIRRRQDLDDVPALERMMHDRAANEEYEQQWLTALRDDKDPNDTDAEEEFEGYVPPVYDAIRGVQVRALEKERLERSAAERRQRLTALRQQKAHREQSAFDQLVAESEVYHFAGGVGGHGGGSSSSGGAGLRRGGASGSAGGDGDDADDASALPRCFITGTPAYIKGVLRPYQVEGVNWLLGLFNRNANGILADEMGLGKTFQTIAAIAYLKFSCGLPGPHLVVVPKSVLGNWFREFRKWCPSLNVFKFHGSSEFRPGLIQMHLKSPVRHDVVLTTFDMVMYEKHAFGRVKWSYLIVDEAHKLKNNESSAHMILDRLHTDHRLLITGTPLQNNLSELWALLHFLAPSLFTHSDSFEQWFNASSGVEDKSAVSRMHLILSPMMIRRLKADVNTGIPPKKEIYVSCRMSTKQRSWYLSTLARDADSLNRASGGSVSQLNNILMQLRKVCNHPYLMPGGEDGPPFVTNEQLVRASGKMVILDKLLAKLLSDKAGKHKVLIFSQFTSMLDILEDFLNYRHYHYCRIDGNTSGLDRDSQMASFNSPSSEKFIFLLSTRAGGLGINLQAANHVIIYDSDWNPQMDLQAQDRAHRIGQKRSVRIYRFITDGTVEERIYKRALKKLYLDAAVVQQGRIANASNSKASKEELLAMVRFGAEGIFASRHADVTDEDIDTLLDQGEQAMAALQTEVRGTTQASLASFKLGADESNLYDFEGINYGGQQQGETRLLHITLEEPLAQEEIERRCSQFGEVSKAVLHPNLKEALVSFRTQAGATDALKGLGLPCQFVNRHKTETTITAEMIEECWELPGTKKLGRGQRNLGQTAAAALTADPFAALATRDKFPLKLPKKPVYPAHQLFNVRRLDHLHQQECEVLARNWKRRNRAAADGTAFEEEHLSPAELDERERLLSDGFGSWSRAEFNTLVRVLSSGEVHRSDYASLATALGGTKTTGQIKDYLYALFDRGPDAIPHFDRIEARIKSADQRLAAKEDMFKALRWKVESTADPEQHLRCALKTKDAALDRLILLHHFDTTMAANRDGGNTNNGSANAAALHRHVPSLPQFHFDCFVRTRPPSFFPTRLKALSAAVKREWARATQPPQRLGNGEATAKKARTEQDEEHDNENDELNNEE